MRRPPSRLRPLFGLPEFILILGLSGVVLMGMIFSFVLPPLEPQRVFPAIPTTASTTSTTSTTTVITSTSTTLATTTTTTTAPVTFAPLAIVCPGDVNITLGSSLALDVTGHAMSSGGNTMDCGSSVISYSDAVDESMIVTKREERSAGLPVGQPRGQVQYGTALYVERLASQPLPPQPFAPQLRALLQARSPTYSFTNLALSAGPVAVAATHGSVRASTTQAVGVSITNTGSVVYRVWSADLTSQLAQFSGLDLVPAMGPCNGTGSAGVVEWDQDADRWLILEQQGSSLCLFVSNTGDASQIAQWTGFALVGPTGVVANPRLGVFPQVYSVTFSATSGNLCVVSRAQVLAGVPTPQAFCMNSLSGQLAGFNVTRQFWTPVGMVGGFATIPEDVESAGTNSSGALFLRHHDDELHDGATTPLYDWLDVEHWTNINLNNATAIVLRYEISVNDFDSSGTGCPQSENACIPTPNATLFLDPVREAISSPLLLRKDYIYGAFVSHANGLDRARIRWFQLRWRTATPTLTARFLLEQDAQVADAVFHLWAPSIAADAYNNTVLQYQVGDNSTTYPGIALRSRLDNDPPTGMRNETLIWPSDGATLSAEQVGMPMTSVFSVEAREYYVSSQRALAGAWTQEIFRVRMLAERLRRTFVAQDDCNATSCEQLILQQ